MWELHHRNRKAGAFEDAAGGRASTPAAEELAAFMASIADSVRPAAPFVSERGWRRLREALDEPAKRSSASRGALAPARGTAILGAAMAGGGLLVAGAASGVDPALIVRQVIVDTPAGRWATGNDVAAPSAAELMVEGTVTTAGRDLIAVDTGTAVVEVRIDGHTSIETLDGREAASTSVEVGGRVKVRARLLADGGFLATSVVLSPAGVPPAGVSTPGAAMVQRAPETPRAVATPLARDPAAVASPTAPAPARPAEDRTPAQTAVRTPAAGGSPGVRDGDTAGATATKDAEPMRTPAAVVTATKTVEPGRTPDPAASPSRTPEPTKTVNPTKTPVASLSPQPADTETPVPGDPPPAPVPVDPAPTTATPLPTPKQTPAPTSDADRTAKEEAPLTDEGSAIFR